MEKKLNQVATFSERFKEAFGDRNATEFAQELGLSKQSISAYLNGSRKPIRTTIEAIAKILDVSPCWLCGYDVPMHSKIQYPNNNDKKNLVVQLNNERELKLVELMQTLLSPDEIDMIIAQIQVSKSKKE